MDLMGFETSNAISNLGFKGCVRYIRPPRAAGDIHLDLDAHYTGELALNRPSHVE